MCSWFNLVISNNHYLHSWFKNNHFSLSWFNLVISNNQFFCRIISNNKNNFYTLGEPNDVITLETLRAYPSWTCQRQFSEIFRILIRSRYCAYANMASGQRSQQSALARSLTEAIGWAIDETLTTIAEVTCKSLFVLFFA